VRQRDAVTAAARRRRRDGGGATAATPSSRHPSRLGATRGNTPMDSQPRTCSAPGHFHAEAAFFTSFSRWASGTPPGKERLVLNNMFYGNFHRQRSFNSPQLRTGITSPARFVGGAMRRSSHGGKVGISLFSCRFARFRFWVFCGAVFFPAAWAKVVLGYFLSKKKRGFTAKNGVLRQVLRSPRGFLRGDFFYARLEQKGQFLPCLECKSTFGASATGPVS